MGQEYNEEKKKPIPNHTSSIMCGVLVGAHSM
jgi:hypothetical protein